MSEMLNWETPFFQFGVGAFETMRSIDGEFPLWPWHRKRLGLALKAWGISEDQLRQADKLIENFKEKGVARVKCLAALVEDQKVEFSLKHQSFQPSDHSRKLLLQELDYPQPLKYKTCNYELHYLARKKALSFECDGSLYVHRGECLETSSASLYQLKGNVLKVASGPALNSICRQRILEYPHLEVIEEPIYLEDLDEGYLLQGSALQVCMPIGEIIDETGAVHYRMKNEGLDLKPINQWLMGVDY